MNFDTIYLNFIRIEYNLIYFLNYRFKGTLVGGIVDPVGVHPQKPAQDIAQTELYS